MNRPANYNTKQSEAILDYIVSLDSAHVTAAQIVEHFARERVAIGRTTIYRHLDKLTAKGKVRKYTSDGASGACYQYMDGAKECHVHLHLKCEDCGELLHLDCQALGHLEQHVLDEHSFQVNTAKTVLYGKCNHCLNKLKRMEVTNSP